jgi:hypothetical protein
MIQIAGDGSRGLTWRRLQRTQAESGFGGRDRTDSPQGLAQARGDVDDDDMTIQSIDTALSLRDYAPPLVENNDSSEHVVTCNGVYFWNGEYHHNYKERNMRSYFTAESMQTRRNVAMLMAMLTSFDMGFCNAIAAISSLSTDALLKAMSLNDKVLTQVCLLY